MIEGEADEIPEDDFIAALHFAPGRSRQRSSPRRRNSPPHAGKTEAQAAALRRRRRTARSRLRTSPATASRPRSTRRARSPARRRSARSRTKSTPRSSRNSRKPRSSRSARRSITSRRKPSASASSTSGVRCDGRDIDDDPPAQRRSRPPAPRPRLARSSSAAKPRRVCLATLGTGDEAQDLDGYTGGETSKRFILHYNFPPFSVGETGRIGSPGRREIGHGALAERSHRSGHPARERVPLRDPRHAAKSWSPTARPRWPPFAAACSPSWTPACRS